MSGYDSFDGGDGVDTVIFRYFDAAVEVDMATPTVARTQDATDLTSGTWRDIASLVNIENVIGSVHGDNLTGNDSANGLYGDDGNDTLSGKLGDDVVFGGAGNDRIIAFEGDGENLYSGGDGFDALDYSASTTSVQVSLLDGDGDDVVTDVEILLGGDFGDRLIGNAGDNTIRAGIGDFDLIQAGDGNDLMIYSEGEDYFYGEGGIDTADYSGFGFAIDADLREQDAVFTSDTADWNDTPRRLITVFFDRDIENLIGTAQNDRLIGDAGANLFNDGQGDDIVRGGEGDDGFAYGGGLDDWDGEGGVDSADFSTYGAAIAVDLGAGTAQGNGTQDLGSGALSARGDADQYRKRGGVDVCGQSGWRRHRQCAVWLGRG